MPTINDMMEVADLFTVSVLAVEQDHCSLVRNRNSKCRACMEACFAGAISLKDDELHIDGGQCVNCGACVAVCPANCITAVDPPAAKVSSAALAAAHAAGGVCVIACARKAAKHEADPDLFAQVPCLAHLTESQLVQLAGWGADDIMLVDGDCATCKYGRVDAGISETVETARRLAEAVGSSPMIVRTSAFPLELAGTFSSDVRGADRRGLMTQTTGYLRTVAGNVANKTIQEKLAPQKQPRKDRFKLKEKFQPAANMRLLDDMLALGEPEPGMLDTRHFGNVEIDDSICSGCGLCVLACPTAALKYAEYDDPEDPERRYLEFQASDCTQCRLCEDACLRKCLHIGSRVPVDELFDFEPRLVEIPRPMDRMNILNKYKR